VPDFCPVDLSCEATGDKAKKDKGKGKIKDLAIWKMAWKGSSLASAAVGQLKFADCMIYERVIEQIAIEAAVDGRSAYLAILYDGLIRDHWEERSAVLKGAFDISLHMSKTNDEFLRLAKRDYDLQLPPAPISTVSAPVAKRERASEAVDSNAASAPSKKAKQVRCFKCNGYGHYANKCQKNAS